MVNSYHVTLLSNIDVVCELIMSVGCKESWRCDARCKQRAHSQPGQSVVLLNYAVMISFIEVVPL